MTQRLAVFASGTGSLLEAMIAEDLPIELVVTDRECRALGVAREAGIDRIFLVRNFSKDFDRETYTENLVQLLRTREIDLIAMAGFMTVFSPAMFADGAYKLKVLNTHPSLLPSFKGDHAVKDALAAGVKVSGCTIHWATEELDAGLILTQEAVKVLPGDTVESLHERIKVVERELYPLILRELIC
ncbi:MAG TPA: phosphoribosylglycinamide formyltransferase [Candidatus Paceibacterota bacterium]